MNGNERELGVGGEGILPAPLKCSGRDASATVWRESGGPLGLKRDKCRFSLGVCLAWLFSGIMALASSFYDPSTFDKKWAYGFLESVEEVVGPETFDGIRYDNAMHLAMRLGPIDRFSMTPEVFVRHICLAEAVEKRFYQKQPLTDDEVKNYLLPLRIRYEHTSKPDWRAVLSKEFSPLVGKTTNPKEAAAVVTGWMHKNLTLLGPASAYRLPMRGDLDPLTVLRGKHGSEIDLAIFGVAVLRSVGVAARLVWTPMMRGEIGGKIWLEYLDEKHVWNTWVPSNKAAGDHRTLLNKQFGEKMVVVLIHPEAPVEITRSYVDTVEVRMSEAFSNQLMTMLVLGKEGLVPAFGVEESESDSASGFHVGRGPVFLAFSSGKLNKSLLRVVPKKDDNLIEIELKDGKPVVARKGPALVSPP